MTDPQSAPAFRRGSFFRAVIILVPGLLLVGGLVARVAGSTEANGWYQSLILPEYQPPGPVFGIVWAVLYTLIAVAAALVWGTRPAPRRGLALALFAAGFLVNLSWSPVFFRLHMISAALAIIGLLFIVALVTTLLFARINRLAAWAMVPYLVWLCVAGTLNARIMMLNPTADATQLGV
jgi:tryptophan-rich sensory protein